MPKSELPVFERAPFAKEVFTPYTKKKFDHLPDYVRKFASELLNHGNVNLAAERAGLKDYYDTTNVVMGEDKSLNEAMKNCGVSSTVLMGHLLECLEANTYKMDKNGNPQKDLRLKLKTLELIFRLRGDFGEDVKGSTDAKGILEMFKNEPGKTSTVSKKGP